MINLKKHDPVADTIRGIMEKELIGNQKKLDKNHNGKLDGQDFKILRGQKKATEETELDEGRRGRESSNSILTPTETGAKSVNKGTPEYAQEKKRRVDLDNHLKSTIHNDKMSYRKTQKEDVEQIDELKKSTLASYAKKAGDESSYYSFAAGSRSEKDPQRKISDQLAMKRLSGVNKAVDRLAKEETEKTEDNLHGRMKTKKKDDVGPGSDFKSSKVELKAEEAELEENAFDYKSPRQPEPNGGSGVKKGSRYGGSKQKEKPEQEEPKEKNESASHFKQRLLEKNWIAGAIKHPGAMTRAAKKAGESTSEYEEKHKHDSGVAGKRARLAITLKGLKKEETEQVEEGMKDALKKIGQKTFKALTGGSDEDQRKDLQRKMGVPQTGKKPTQKEEVEVEEGLQQKLRKVVPGYAKRQINKKMDDQKFGRTDVDKDANYYRYKKLLDQANEEVDQVQEVAPPGFEGTVRAMKKHKDVTNPFALAWSMKNKGYKSHKKADGSDK